MYLYTCRYTYTYTYTYTFTYLLSCMYLNMCVFSRMHMNMAALVNSASSNILKSGNALGQQKFLHPGDGKHMRICTWISIRMNAHMG